MAISGNFHQSHLIPINTMPLSKVQKGKFSFFTIETGRFSLDGGAMFGVVPKTMWSKKIESDEKNRIPMAMRCLLVHSSETDRLYLIDNGAGTKFDEKMSAIYGLYYDEGTLESSLAEHGFSVDDITDMIFTHLHFDHCGGSTAFNEDGEAEIVFKNATHWVSRKQWVNANTANEREKASFLPENIEPLRQSRKLKLITENHEFEKGFTIEMVNGHTKGQILPCFDTDNFKMVYGADLLPTHAHIPLPWIMGYDLYPVDTLSEKKKLLEKWSNEGRYLYLEHDAEHEIVTIEKKDDRYSAGKSLTLNEL